MVERVGRQVAAGEQQVQALTAKVKAFLKAGDRKTAGQLAIQLQKAQQELAENRQQLQLHEQAYQNNVEKIKHASKSLAQVREKIQKYQAELKMSKAEAEMARLSQAFQFDVTTDFGELEQVIQDEIDANRGAVRVAADLSGQGLEEIRAQKAMEESLAEDLLSRFEVDMGLKSPETAAIAPAVQPLGPEEQALAQVAPIEESR
ncbi:MAG: hypothetical protein FJ125_00840 [Deltaproteobacteria bacterium]|nr:hypothetical protein [Deltaproteobacteria bacterium]